MTNENLADKFQLTKVFFQQQVASQANKMDRHPQVLKSALQAMGDRSLLALKVPSELGGAGLSELDYRRLQILMARASGALTFLQTQHQSAATMLAKSPNQSLQQQFLPQAATGESLIGVGFSHLRRRTPMITATPTREGYLITGEVPWITGYDFFAHFILGATLPDGQELYGMLPLQNRLQGLGGKISLSKPMALMAMSATNTVSAQINQWFLSCDRLITIKPAGSIHQSSRKNILNHGFFALGCAYAGLDVLQTVADQKPLAFLRQSWQSLTAEVKQCEQQAITSTANSDATYQQRLQLRAWAIDLAERSSLAAVIASSGAANYLNSSAGRIYREALLFSVSGQTTDVMEVSLKRLLRDAVASDNNA
ncbi:acyl-CoA dehydrogenase family protein [Pleurocapsa sp. PCC 7319]|uniref:acyl-CoA dehydrogenase family protein n=1 Tax=Pleurocapsa sp. PCC 7319 TaxID=118161 RepID=UPI000347ECF5|nr:acyl-CoA dehydrogenase family protein [Pleurocapsa sp. PCC 7319]